MAVYEIEEFLGEGGFAFVYRARDRNLDIDVALKVLKPAFAYDEEFEENFRREAHRAAKFRHPNVIAIHYAGKENDLVFFSMDLLERGLKDYLQGEPLDPSIIIKVGMDVASALQFAHKHEGGIIHRDLKPDNILFDRHGNAVVTDFGISEAATNYTAATGTTVYVGTPKYMSPEQARGQRVDPRSDIYSLGVTLYEMAVGRPPFDGRDWFELGRQHIEKVPPLPREHNPDLPPALERVILRCLQKNPADRYQSADEIRAELGRLQDSRGATLTLPAEPRAAGNGSPGPRPGVTGSPTARPASPSLHASTTVTTRRRGIRTVAAVVFAGLIVGTTAAYKLDLAGFQAWAERQVPAVAGVPVLGSGHVYARSPSFHTIEGGADVSGAISLPFTGPLDPMTATSANVRLLGPDSTALAAQISVADGGRGIRIEPVDSLAFETEYTVAVGAGLLSVRGVPIHQSPEATEPGARFVLKTRPPPPDRDPPRLVETLPQNGDLEAGIDAPITLRFNEPLDPASVDSGSITLHTDDGSPVPGELFWSADFKKVRIHPRDGLRPATGYLVRLDSRLADRSGNRMPPESLVFRTAARSSGPPATGPASIDVRVLPANARYVSVVIDSDTVGPPPIRRYEIVGGRRHTVEIVGMPEFSAHGISLYRRQFTVRPGSAQTVMAEIQPFGSISVNSEPVGTVYIDGKAIGRVPLAGYPVLANRRHTLEITPLPTEEASYRPFRVEFEVQPYEWKILGRVELPPR